MDAHFAVSLQIQFLRRTCVRRMTGSGQKWQKGVGVALTETLTPGPVLSLSRTTLGKRKNPVAAGSGERASKGQVAEGVGFEPTDALTSAVFKTAAIDHSATLPQLDLRTAIVGDAGADPVRLA